MNEITIKELLKTGIAFMGSDWQEDENAPDDSPIKGHIYKGEIPCINCNDLFCWGFADDGDISEETLPELNSAVKDCCGDLETGALLYCCRKREMRPQGAYYTYIPKQFWWLFHACGEKRKTGFGNPYEIGKYNTNNLDHV